MVLPQGRGRTPNAPSGSTTTVRSTLAIESLDEGLRKDPGNAWLLTRKA